ncbi:hypothetical protein NXS98_07405 [Fontisphaera persica]|uniref:hypothetical protein n=1 Tax=Fontisphaera persica TaxID=2974023 RepID=UPI0024C090B5|nr:hypothetical protein [Fontisphaera persica]WCJ60936.1 hypothetical protein NXS98_07405 [Fontisphaera persica]
MILYLQTLPLEGQPPDAWADPRLCHIFAAYLYWRTVNLNKVIYRHPTADAFPTPPDWQPASAFRKDLLHALWTELHHWAENYPNGVLVAYQARQRVIPTLLFRNFAHDLRLPFLDNPNLPSPMARFLDLAEVYRRQQAGRSLPLAEWFGSWVSRRRCRRGRLCRHCGAASTSAPLG